MLLTRRVALLLAVVFSLTVVGVDLPLLVFCLLQIPLGGVHILVPFVLDAFHLLRLLISAFDVVLARLLELLDFGFEISDGFLQSFHLSPDSFQIRIDCPNLRCDSVDVVLLRVGVYGLERGLHVLALGLVILEGLFIEGWWRLD